MIEKPTNKLFKDLTDQTFEKLLVKEYAGVSRPDRPKKKNHQWLCQCECGNSKIVMGDNLRAGTTISCGCIQKERTSKARRSNLAGNVYGKLTAIKFSHTDNKDQSYWLCKCECGNIKPINTASLKSGRSKSCGCRQGRFIHGMWGKPGYKALYLKDPVKKLRHNIGVAVRDALQKNKNGSVWDYLPYTSEELKEHLEKQFESWMTWDNYGGPNDSPEKTWTIDHIKPQSAFLFSSMGDSQFIECWCLTNLRPLEKVQNFKKGCSLLSD